MPLPLPFLAVRPSRNFAYSANSASRLCRCFSSLSSRRDLLQLLLVLRRHPERAARRTPASAFRAEGPLPPHNPFHQLCHPERRCSQLHREHHGRRACPERSRRDPEAAGPRSYVQHLFHHKARPSGWPIHTQALSSSKDENGWGTTEARNFTRSAPQIPSTPLIAMVTRPMAILTRGQDFEGNMYDVPVLPPAATAGR